MEEFDIIITKLEAIARDTRTDNLNYIAHLQLLVDEMKLMHEAFQRQEKLLTEVRTEMFNIVKCLEINQVKNFLPKRHQFIYVKDVGYFNCKNCWLITSETDTAMQLEGRPCFEKTVPVKVKHQFIFRKETAYYKCKTCGCEISSEKDVAILEKQICPKT